MGDLRKTFNWLEKILNKAMHGRYEFIFNGNKVGLYDIEEDEDIEDEYSVYDILSNIDFEPFLGVYEGYTETTIEEIWKLIDRMEESLEFTKEEIEKLNK